MKKIEGLPGVRGIGKAVLLWVFDPNRAWIVLGIEQQNKRRPIGASLCRHRRAFSGRRQIRKPSSKSRYARQFSIKVGDTISVAKAHSRSSALIDASRAAKIAIANVYLPLAEAQKLAAASSQVQSVSPFNAG